MMADTHLCPNTEVGEGGAKSHRSLKSLACYFFSMGKYHYMTSLTSLQIISQSIHIIPDVPQ